MTLNSWSLWSAPAFPHAGIRDKSHYAQLTTLFSMHVCVVNITYINTYYKQTLRDWRYNEVVKSTKCSPRRPGFSSQHPYNSSQPSVNSSSKGSNTVFWLLPAPGTCVVHTYTCKQNTRIHQNNWTDRSLKVKRKEPHSPQVVTFKRRRLLCCRGKTPEQDREGRVYCGSRFEVTQSITPPELEAVREQRARNIAIRLPLSILVSLGSQSVNWCCSHEGRFLLLHLS